MKKFMAVFTGSKSGDARARWDAMDASQRKDAEGQGMKAWGEWMSTHQASIVEGGGPLGKTKRISRSGIVDTSNELAAFILVQAESHEAAAKLFEKHPHFMIFPGDAVEIMECLPIPGQR